MNAAQLTTRQARFIDEFLVDSNGAQAAIRAGYSPGSAKVAASRMLTKDNPISRAIKTRQDDHSVQLGITRQKVVASLLGAAEMAREQKNPMALIAAAREMGKLLGFYAPEVRKVALTAEQGGVQHRMETMTDAELLAVVASAGQ